MSDRSVKVNITADTSAFIDAMKTAHDATDAFRDSLKELRKEQRSYASEITNVSWTGGEIADAVFGLLDAGVSREDIRSGALTGTLVLAGSTETPIDETAKITGIAAKRFHLGGNELASVSDLVASQAPKAEMRYEGMPYHTVFTDSRMRPGLGIKVDETRPGHVKVDVTTSERDQLISIYANGEKLLSKFTRTPEA